MRWLPTRDGAGAALGGATVLRSDDETVAPGFGQEGAKTFLGGSELIGAGGVKEIPTGFGERAQDTLRCVVVGRSVAIHPESARAEGQRGYA